MLPLVRAVESLEVVGDWFHRRSARDAVAVLLQGCATHGASFWAWDAAAWTDVLGTSGNAFLTTYPRWARTSARSYAIALAYLLGFTELHLLGNVGRGAVARKVFGRAAVEQAVEQVTSVLHGWGQRSPQVTARTASLFSHALLLNRSPLLADLSEDALRGLRENLSIPIGLGVQPVHDIDLRCLLHSGRAQADRAHAVGGPLGRERAIECLHRRPGGAHTAHQRYPEKGGRGCVHHDHARFLGDHVARSCSGGDEVCQRIGVYRPCETLQRELGQRSSLYAVFA
jgi:hypothetical protein